MDTPRHPQTHTLNWLNSHLPFSKTIIKWVRRVLFILDQWLSNFKVQQKSLVRLFKHRVLGPISQSFDSVCLGWGLRIRFSNKFRVMLVLLAHTLRTTILHYYIFENYIITSHPWLYINLGKLWKILTPVLQSGQTKSRSLGFGTQLLAMFTAFQMVVILSQG